MLCTAAHSCCLPLLAPCFAVALLLPSPSALLLLTDSKLPQQYDRFLRSKVIFFSFFQQHFGLLPKYVDFRPLVSSFLNLSLILAAELPNPPACALCCPVSARIPRPAISKKLLKCSVSSGQACFCARLRAFSPSSGDVESSSRSVL